MSLELLDDKWEIVKHAPAVAVLALQDGKILGVRQERRAISQMTWEVPAGLIDEGETPREAAERELAEETQFGGNLRLITQVYSSPGFTDEKIYIFEAQNLREAAGELDEGEVLSVTWEDPQRLWEKIASGQLATSGPALIALQYALQTLKSV